MLPDIQPKNRDHIDLADPLHQRVILIGSGAYLKGPIRLDTEPSPSGPEPVSSFLVEEFAHLVDRAPFLLDTFFEGSMRGYVALADWCHPFPKQRVVVMTTTVVTDCNLTLSGMTIDLHNVINRLVLAHKRLITYRGQELYFEGVIQLGDICLVMHIMMELHGLGIDVGLKSSEAVRKIRKGEHRRR